MAEFALTIIGCGSALPMHGRHPSAQVIQYDDSYFLIDCGESTQMRLRDAGIRPFKISVILISHLHGDHFFGLPGLLSSFTHLHRKEELFVHGPVGIKALLDEIIRYTELKINYPLHIIEHDPKNISSIWRKQNLEILTFPLNHRIRCKGYLFREIAPVLKLKKESVQKINLAPEQLKDLRNGKDIWVDGEKIQNSLLAFGHDRRLSYAYCSDTKYDERLVPWIKYASVLYHETTFSNELSEMADHTGHSTASDAGKIAKAADVACLITGHYSSRYKKVDLLIKEAKAHFPIVLEAVEGQRYNIRAIAEGEFVQVRVHEGGKP